MREICTSFRPDPQRNEATPPSADDHQSADSLSDNNVSGHNS
ncbi:hypothetical protein VIMS_00164 [Mycobacterium marinum]|nr:hypothetical protein VIMS_00164 [Mycobacterium marinum]